MVPPLPQLLADPAREVVDQPRPAPFPVRGDERAELGVLLLGPLPLDLGDRVAAAAAAVRCGGGGLGVGLGGELGVLLVFFLNFGIFFLVLERWRGRGGKKVSFFLLRFSLYLSFLSLSLSLSLFSLSLFSLSLSLTLSPHLPLSYLSLILSYSLYVVFLYLISI